MNTKACIFNHSSANTQPSAVIWILCYISLRSLLCQNREPRIVYVGGNSQPGAGEDVSGQEISFIRLQ